MNEEAAERIAVALERIAESLEAAPEPTTAQDWPLHGDETLARIDAAGANIQLAVKRALRRDLSGEYSAADLLAARNVGKHGVRQLAEFVTSIGRTFPGAEAYTGERR